MHPVQPVERAELRQAVLQVEQGQSRRAAAVEEAQVLLMRQMQMVGRVVVEAEGPEDSLEMVVEEE